MPQAAFATLGCKVNQFDTLAMEGLFKKAGYDIVSFNERADVYIINTCVVTNTGEKKSRQLIHRAVRQNPQAVIAVTGCYAQTKPSEVLEIEGINLVVGNQDRHRIVELVEKTMQQKDPVSYVNDIMQAKEFEEIELYDTPHRTRAFLKIQEGCSNFCSYCIIPYARGPLKSRKLENIKKEVCRLVDAGFKEIVLTGIHLGAYGSDFGDGTTLADAVSTVLEVDGLLRLRLGSLESVEVEPRLIKLMQEDKRLCPHLHLPLQAADDYILNRMNRTYSTSQFYELINNIKCRIPGVSITTDIITGFPGETDTIFEKSLELIEKMEFARIHVFPFSPRTGTPAASFPEQIPEHIKNQRADRLIQLANKSSRQHNAKFIGHTMDVLLETKHNDMVDGLTGNYIRVYVKQTSECDTLSGKIVKVLIKDHYKDGLLAVI